MIDKFDYMEPSCVLCGGEDFYYPKADAPKGYIPIQSVLAKLDYVEWKNDMAEATRLLEYWEQEGTALGDERGLLTIYSEQMGLYRKTLNEEKGIRSVEKGLHLLDKLGLGETVSGATITLNAATTLKAFGRAKDALPLYEKVKKIYDEYVEDDDPKKAGFYNNAALCYADVGDKTRAEEYYNKALDVLSRCDVNTENEKAVTYVNLAHLCDTIEGRQDDVFEYMEKAMQILYEQKKQDGAYAAVCEKCAPSFGYFGYFIAEEECKRRAKKIYEGA